MTKIFLTVLLFAALFLSCGKDPQKDIYPKLDNDAVVDKNDSDNSLPVDESSLPDNDDPVDKDTDIADPDKDSEQITPDDEKNDPDNAPDLDADELQDDSENIPVCFNKPCDEHADCSIDDGNCKGYSDDEKYACFPDITDFGYQGGGTCVEINCSINDECRKDLGYMCIDFGFPVPEFDDAETGCLLSIIGESCTEEGKKLCQFGLEIALECVDGVWKPTYCENGDICEAGECIPEPTDSDETNDDDIIPPIEICDNIDNNGNGQIDEGCDKDGDGWCDMNMIVIGKPDVCPKGGQDCNDNNANIYPGSKIHIEGVDYDCDNRKEYQAVVVLSVDDELVELCANGRQFSKAEFGAYFGAWTYADTYSGEKLVLESGINVIGVHGKDTGFAISAFIATIHVNGIIIVTDGVLPPASGIAYTPSDFQWTQSQWRYFPTVASGPNGDWCDKWFDDSEWGPAIKAGQSPTSDENWGNLGTKPWTTTACGATMCPSAFISPYYEPGFTGNKPKWIWDYNPTSLADAWLRIKIDLP